MWTFDHRPFLDDSGTQIEVATRYRNEWIPLSADDFIYASAAFTRTMIIPIKEDPHGTKTS